MKKFLKITLITILSIGILFGILVGALNMFKSHIYSEYYSMKEDLAINNGLGEGYVPQGLTYVEEDNIYLTSGYLDNRPSRIYVNPANAPETPSISKGKEYYYLEVTLNGEYVYDHFGGIANDGRYAYLTGEESIYILALADILNKDNKEVEIIKEVELDIQTSYCYVDDNTNILYVGEFNNGKQYVTTNIEKVENGTHYAYVRAYQIEDILLGKAEPIFTLSVRDEVQGIAVSNNYIYLSTSYGLANSYLYIYDIPTTFDRDEDKIYLLDERYYVDEVKMPPMLEDLDFANGQVIGLYESACNKYFFGKLFMANKIVGLNYENRDN